jgi:hypothetical protein
MKSKDGINILTSAQSQYAKSPSWCQLIEQMAYSSAVIRDFTCSGLPSIVNPLNTQFGILFLSLVNVAIVACATDKEQF